MFDDDRPRGWSMFLGRAGRDASLRSFRQLRDTISKIVSQSVARQAAPECDTIWLVSKMSFPKMVHSSQFHGGPLLNLL